MGNKKICVIPGTYDPVTNGHLDIIVRAAELFDKIYVVSFDNTVKKTMFNAKERLEMLKLACEALGENGGEITVDATSELVVDYAVSKGADFIVKGVRNTIDYEYEYNLFLINREIGKKIKIETLFFPAALEHLHISSSFVREMIIYEKDITDYVPESVKKYIGAIYDVK